MKLRKIKNAHIFLTLSTLVTLITLGTFCSSSPTQSSPERPQVVVDSDITEDTVWEGGNDYIINRTIEVRNNSNLHIHPDVYIYYDVSMIEGFLIKVREGSSFLCETDDDLQSEIQFVNIGNENRVVNGILLEENSKGIIKNISIEKFNIGIEIYKADSVFIENSDICNCQNAIINTRCNNIWIKNSCFSNNSVSIKFDFTISNDSISNVINNEFNGNEIGCEMNNYSSLIIADNYFVDCQMGISLEHNSNLELLQNNFKQCRIGCKIAFYSSSRIYNNIFQEGFDCFVLLQYLSGMEILISNNDFYNCDNYKIIAGIGTFKTKINAINNYWESIDSLEIARFIFDENDAIYSTDYGKVEYIPFTLMPTNN